MQDWTLEHGKGNGSGFRKLELGTKSQEPRAKAKLNPWWYNVMRYGVVSRRAKTQFGIRCAAGLEGVC